MSLKNYHERASKIIHNPKRDLKRRQTMSTQNIWCIGSIKNDFIRNTILRKPISNGIGYSNMKINNFSNN